MFRLCDFLDICHQIRPEGLARTSPPRRSTSSLWGCPTQQPHGGHFSLFKNGQRLCQGCVHPRWRRSNKTAWHFAMGVNTQLTVLEVQSGWFPLQMREDFVLLFRNTYFYFNSPSHHSWIFQDLWDQARVSTSLNTGARKDGAKTKVISFFLKMVSWGFSSRGPGFNLQHPRGTHNHLKP